MKKCKITVMKKTEYPDLSDRYEQPMEHPCDMELGQTFIVSDLEKPEGLCDSAWVSLYPFVMALSSGGSEIYDDWMKEGNTAMVSCNDGFRPVSFLVEALEDET